MPIAAETSLRRRIAPSTPLKLELVDDNGDKFVKNFKLAFDYNAATYVEQKSGFGFLDGEIWGHLTATNIGILFYAAVLCHHPEYDTLDRQGNPDDLGLDTIRSYTDMENSPAVVKALNDAYVRQMPPERRARALKLQAEIEAKLARGEEVNPQTPAATDAATAGA